MIRGITFPDLAGRSVRRAGDVNGDGFDDVVIGAPDDKRFGSNTGDVRARDNRSSSIDTRTLSILSPFLSTLASEHNEKQKFSYSGWTCYLVAHRGYEYRLCSAGADLTQLNDTHWAVVQLVDQGIRIPMLSIYLHSRSADFLHPDPDVRAGRKKSPGYWIQARGPRFEPVANVFIDLGHDRQTVEIHDIQARGPRFEHVLVLEALGSLLHERSAGDHYWVHEYSDQKALDDERRFVAGEFAKVVLERESGVRSSLSPYYFDLRGHPLQ